MRWRSRVDVYAESGLGALVGRYPDRRFASRYPQELAVRDLPQFVVNEAEQPLRGLRIPLLHGKEQLGNFGGHGVGQWGKGAFINNELARTLAIPVATCARVYLSGMSKAGDLQPPQHLPQRPRPQAAHAGSQPERTPEVENEHLGSMDRYGG